MDDVPEGAFVVSQVGEVEDAPFITRQLDDKVGEAAGAAGVKEDQGGAAGREPSAGIIIRKTVHRRNMARFSNRANVCPSDNGPLVRLAFRHSCDGAAQATQGGGEVYQPVVLQRFHPFGVIADGGVYSSVAPGGAGDTLVAEIYFTGRVAGKPQRAMTNIITFIDGGPCYIVHERMIHVQGDKYSVFYKRGEGLM